MISSWMKGLVIYLLLSGLVMKLIPGKNYERYVSFYMGLILVIMLAKPVFLLFRLNNGDVAEIIDNADKYQDFDNYYSDGKISPSKSTYYELGFEESLKEACIKGGYDVQQASVITDKAGNVLNVSLYVKGEIDENVLKNFIYEVYKIDTESIYIVRR